MYDLFFSSLSPKIRKGINESKTYIRPDYSRMETHSDHLGALVALKNEASPIWDEQKEQHDHIPEKWRELSAAGKSSSHHHHQQRSSQRGNTLFNTADNQDDAADHCLESEQHQEGDVLNPNHQHIRFDHQPPAVTFRHAASAAEDTISRATAGAKHDRDDLPNMPKVRVL
jgi:hypothetical protein